MGRKEQLMKESEKELPVGKEETQEGAEPPENWRGMFREGSHAQLSQMLPRCPEAK